MKIYCLLLEYVKVALLNVFVSNGDQCKVGLENPVRISRTFYTFVLIALK